LLDVTEREFAKLDRLIDGLTSEQAVEKHADDTSIKDVVGHRAHWILLFLGWYRDGLAGRTVHFPAKGYKWNQLKDYNRQLRAEQAGLSWPDVKNRLRTNHRKLSRFIEGCSEEALYGAPMQGANNQWTPGRWAEAAGASHYRSAAKFIRQCSRTAK